MQIMDGRRIAEERLLELKKYIEMNNLYLSLAIVRSLKDPVSEIYVNSKKKALEMCGIRVVVYDFDENIAEESFKNNIRSIGEDGLIVQLPLPVHINKANILNSIDSKKDVDVFSAHLLGKYYLKIGNIIPPVTGAVEILLKEYNIEIRGKNVALIGAGDLVGKPLSLFFMREGATLSILNKFTDNISFYTKNADIIVSGVGAPKIIKGDMVKEGAIVIDAGTSAFSSKIVGDIDIEEVKEKTSYLAKVPGGVGPLTTYCLVRNLLELKKRTK